MHIHLVNRRGLSFGTAVGFSVAVALLLTAPVATRDQDGRAFLMTSFGFSAKDLERADAGQVVGRTLTATDKREFATLGVVRIAIPPEFYVDRLSSDVASLKNDEAVLQIGMFGNPPDIKDVAKLTLDESDVRNLRGCRVGSCGVQLSAEAIRQFQQDVDWRRADATDQANGLMRRLLVGTVSDYLKRGNSAFVEYADQSSPLNMAKEFVALAGAPGPGWNQFPALRQYLLDFPATDLPGVLDRLYWSKEKVGRRTVVSATHLAMAKMPKDSPAEYAIASKHLYGSHYVDASLGLTVLVRDRRSASPMTYMVYLNRSRVDVFSGLLGPMARHIVSGRARSTVSEQLARLQRQLQLDFAKRGAGALLRSPEGQGRVEAALRPRPY